MIFRFRGLPGITETVARPVVGVHIQGIEEVDLPCLVDSGSLHNRFAAWIAAEAGIDLVNVAPMSLGVGGRSTIARTVTVGLRLGDLHWEAPVSFCDPWPWDFNLLGQEGFLRWFQVLFRVADRELEVTPASLGYTGG